MIALCFRGVPMLLLPASYESSLLILLSEAPVCLRRESPYEHEGESGF